MFAALPCLAIYDKDGFLSLQIRDFLILFQPF